MTEHANLPATMAALSPDKIEAIETVAKGLDLVKMETMDRVQAMVAVSDGVAALRTLLTDEVVTSVKKNLEGHSLGFRTDRDDFAPNHRDDRRRGEKGYPIAVIRDCMIHALVFGARLTMDDFNIIGGNFYARKPCLLRKCKTFPGVSNFDMEPGVPKLMVEQDAAGYRDKGANTRGRKGQTGAIVPMTARWTMEGEAVEMTRNIPVKLNAFMGVDAAVGKATRKMAAQVLERLTGRPVPEGELEDIRDVEATVVDARPTGQGARARTSAATDRVPPRNTNGDGAADEGGTVPPDPDSGVPTERDSPTSDHNSTPPESDSAAPDPAPEQDPAQDDSRAATERSAPTRDSASRAPKASRKPPPAKGKGGSAWVDEYRTKWKKDRPAGPPKGDPSTVLPEEEF